MEADEAKAIFAALSPVESKNAGRDFFYTVHRNSGEVEGQVVDRGEDELVLLNRASDSNDHVSIPWSDIAGITITVEP